MWYLYSGQEVRVTQVSPEGVSRDAHIQQLLFSLRKEGAVDAHYLTYEPWLKSQGK
jgi:hypothetical protein